MRRVFPNIRFSIFLPISGLLKTQPSLLDSNYSCRLHEDYQSCKQKNIYRDRWSTTKLIFNARNRSESESAVSDRGGIMSHHHAKG